MLRVEEDEKTRSAQMLRYGEEVGFFPDRAGALSDLGFRV